MALSLRSLPIRLATGAFVAHSGYEKWSGGEEQAAFVHGAASGAYPFLGDIPPARFLRMLSVGELAVGTALLAPFVPNRLAGAALTGFAGGLMGLYARTPAMRKPGSIWPSQQGIAVSKDVWMLGIGLSLLLDPGRDD